MGHYAAEMGERGGYSGPAMTREEEEAWRSEAFALIAASREIHAALGIKLSCSHPRVRAYLAERNRRGPELEPLRRALADASRKLRAEAMAAVFGPSPTSPVAKDERHG